MPFKGFKDFDDCVSKMTADGKDMESAKKMCSIMQAEEEKFVVLEDGSQCIKNKHFNFSESICVTETDSDAKPKWVKVSGMALEATTSRNNRTYIEGEVSKQHGREGKMFMNHDTHPMNAVGKFKFAWEGGKLNHFSEIRNTHNNPDVVEMIRDKLIDKVSIGASGDVVRIKKGNEEQFQIRNMEIHELSLVGIPGVDGAGIDTVISESFKPYDNKVLIPEKSESKKAELKPKQKFIIIKKVTR